MSLGCFVDILDRNFCGDEYFRAKLVNKIPKYGNNIPEVDNLARQVGQAYCNEVSRYQCIRGGEYRPGLFPVASHVPLGRVVGALPSGRLSETPLNDGISPVSGCDVNGPTAVLLSVSKVNHLAATNGTLLNMKIHPTALKTEEDMRKLCALIRIFMKLNLMHVQFNVVSREELIEAQRDPGNHRDLLVRVAGYSANFVDLDQKMQDDIINRTQQEL
jgi:formate C-acetyltransferase